MVDNIRKDDPPFDPPPAKVSVELNPIGNEIFQPDTKIIETVLKPSTILIVEDNPDNMITIKAVLQNRYPILEARDGEEGLKIATESSSNLKLILLDMAMPKMDGMTVIKHLKNDPNLRHIPTVALTAKVKVDPMSRPIFAFFKLHSELVMQDDFALFCINCLT